MIGLPLIELHGRLNGLHRNRRSVYRRLDPDALRRGGRWRGEVIEDDDAIARVRIILGDREKTRLNAGDSREDWAQKIGLFGIDGDWRHAARRQFKNCAAILAEGFGRREARFQPSAGAGPETKREAFLRAGRQLEAVRCNWRSAEIYKGGNRARRRAVILCGEEDFPDIRIFHGAVDADFAQANMFGGALNRDDAEVRRRIETSGFIARNASRADEYDFARTLGLHSLRSPREIDCALEIQRRGAGLCLIDCELDLLAVRLEQESGCGEDTGSHNHYSIGLRKRIDIVARGETRLIDEAIGAEAVGHPRGNVENQHVIARIADWRAKADLSDGKQQQQQAEQLQKERPGLLQLAAMLQDWLLFGNVKKTQGRDGVMLAPAVQQIQRHDDTRERPQDREELGQGKIEEEHRGLLESA